jgi:hypothetical protein
MTGKMNWRRASLAGRPTLSTKFEDDGMERRDAAARWLNHANSWRHKKKKNRRERAKEKHQRYAAKKNRNNVGADGPPCPRCHRATEIREHAKITEKILAQPFYYSRWYYCRNPHCRTNVIHDDRFRVWNDSFSDAAFDVLDQIGDASANPPTPDDQEPPW